MYGIRALLRITIHDFERVENRLVYICFEAVASAAGAEEQTG